MQDCPRPDWTKAKRSLQHPRGSYGLRRGLRQQLWIPTGNMATSDVSPITRPHVASALPSSPPARMWPDLPPAKPNQIQGQSSRWKEAPEDVFTVSLAPLTLRGALGAKAA